MANVTEWTDFGGFSSVTAFSATPTVVIFYKVIEKLCFINFYLSGTSNSTATTFTVPFTSKNITNNTVKVAIAGTDSGSALAGPASATLPANSATVTCYKDMATTVWTASNAKLVSGQFFYEIA